MSSTLSFTLFPLLPLELRLAIWYLALPTTSRISDDKGHTPSSKARPRISHLLTCKESHFVLCSNFTKVTRDSASTGRRVFFIDFHTDWLELKLWQNLFIEPSQYSCTPPNSRSAVKRIYAESTPFLMAEAIWFVYTKILFRDLPGPEVVLIVLRRGGPRHTIKSSQRDEFLRYIKATVGRRYWANELFVERWKGRFLLWHERAYQQQLPRVLFDVEDLIEDREEGVRREVDMRTILDDDNPQALIQKYSRMMHSA